MELSRFLFYPAKNMKIDKNLIASFVTKIIKFDTVQ